MESAVQRRIRKQSRWIYSEHLRDIQRFSERNVDPLVQLRGKASVNHMHMRHEEITLKTLAKGFGEEAVVLCGCKCYEAPMRAFRERRIAIYAALWSLQQGCPGEVWGDVFVGGLGQMMWTFPFK